MPLVEKLWNKVSWILWVALVCALPLTSVPLVSKLTGSVSVAPGSLLFLIPLVLIAIPGILYFKKRLPFHIKPALIFFFFAFTSILLALFLNVPDYKDQSISAAAVEGAITLGLRLFF